METVKRHVDVPPRVGGRVPIEVLQGSCGLLVERILAEERASSDAGVFQRGGSSPGFSSVREAGPSGGGAPIAVRLAVRVHSVGAEHRRHDGHASHYQERHAEHRDLHDQRQPAAILVIRWQRLHPAGHLRHLEPPLLPPVARRRWADQIPQTKFRQTHGRPTLPAETCRIRPGVSMSSLVQRDMSLNGSRVSTGKR